MPWANYSNKQIQKSFGTEPHRCKLHDVCVKTKQTNNVLQRTAQTAPTVWTQNIP